MIFFWRRSRANDLWRTVWSKRTMSSVPITWPILVCHGPKFTGPWLLRRSWVTTSRPIWSASSWWPHPSCLWIYCKTNVRHDILPKKKKKKNVRHDKLTKLWTLTLVLVRVPHLSARQPPCTLQQPSALALRYTHYIFRGKRARCSLFQLGHCIFALHTPQANRSM